MALEESFGCARSVTWEFREGEANVFYLSHFFVDTKVVGGLHRSDSLPNAATNRKSAKKRFQGFPCLKKGERGSLSFGGPLRLRMPKKAQDL